MYYIYILYSQTSDLYYVGYSDNPQRRLIEHNTVPLNTFTSKHRPWIMKAIFRRGEMKSIAVETEQFIKKQRSRKLLERLCNSQLQPTGKLALLVRVPDIRD